jgi:regulatory protein
MNKQGPGADETQTLQLRLEHFCAYRERCSHEVLLKLKTWNISESQSRKLLTELREQGFINDHRFARVFVRSKFHQIKWGRIRIMLELKSRHIQEHIITEALKEITEEEYLQMLESLIRKKKEEIKAGKNLNIRDKLFNFAFGRGFESDLILEIINKLKI